MIFNSVWVEKYRPHNLSDLVISEKNRNILQGLINKKVIPNMTICSSEPGIGKTSIAKMLAEMFCEKEDILFINGSLNRNIDTIRNEMTDFMMRPSERNKFIILDEADGMSGLAQQALRNFIEEYSEFSTFILTCNNVTKIIEPILSRCAKFDLTIDDSTRQEIAVQMLNRCISILRNELIEFEEVAIKKLIKEHFPDMRLIISMLQRLSSQGGINSDNLNIQTSIKNVNELDVMLLGVKERDWNSLRIWAHNYANDNYIYNKIYDYLLPYIDPKLLDSFIILCGEYSYRSDLTQYKEINLSAFVAELIKGKIIA